VDSSIRPHYSRLQIAEACSTLERMLQSDVRCRFVIDLVSLEAV
jgi:D-arabinose 1-dehydrogenase-like Zn-dependent alcohol dehydrogenase